MRSLTRAVLTIAAAVAIDAATATASLVVDGVLDTEYGAALATQTTQTSFNNANASNSSDPVRYADGSELDGFYARVDGDVLHLLLAGNLGFCCATSFSHQEVFHLFIDCQPGGQPTLRADNPMAGGWSLVDLAGLTFDPGFEPDYWLGCTVNMASSFAELLAGGGGQGCDLGSNPVGAPGTLVGGRNPYGILAAVNNTNGAGVTMGCAAASGSGVTTGVEWAIPLAAIGGPRGCFRACVLVADAESAEIGNQAFGPLPPGTSALGAAEGVNLGSLPGNQHVTICPPGSEARNETWGQLKTIYR
ncbi:MAG: hypothetical protein ACRENJ_10065 [Candidatus Eiseniibacteriota bacterium]